MKLLSDHTSSLLIEKVCRNPDLLMALVPWLTHNLIEAWDWRLAFHKIERHEDYSRIDLASISSDPGNHCFQNWSKIVELLRDGFVLLAERDFHRARVIAEFWCEADYPIFHRLYLFAMAEVDGMARSSDMATYFKHYLHVMFASSCEREILGFFRKRGRILSKKAAAQVCARILKGLDRTQYIPMSNEEWDSLN